MNKRIPVLLALLLFFYMPLLAQEHENEAEHEKHQRHKLTAFTGYHFSVDAIDSEGNDKLSIIPAFGLNYEFSFSEKIGLALVNEIALQSYTVEENHETILEREYPITTALVFLYEILPGWAVYAGPGYEFEGNENFFVVKIGSDIVKEFEHGWLAGIALSYDFKEVNNIFGAGFIIGKRLGKAK